jgi:hypothetical protein
MMAKVSIGLPFDYLEPSTFGNSLKQVDLVFNDTLAEYCGRFDDMQPSIHLIFPLAPKKSTRKDDKRKIGSDKEAKK